MAYTFTVSTIKDKIRLEIPKDVYYPEEDSFLLLDTLIEQLNEEQRLLLELGGGSGLITIALAKKFKKARYIVNDICFSSAQTIYKNIKLNGVQDRVDVVQMDMLNGLRKFNPSTVVWNPPYLPIDDDAKLFSLSEQKMLFGGKKGYEQAYTFLKKCIEKFVTTTVFTIVSSLGWTPTLISRLNKKGGVRVEIINRKKLPFETLYVIKMVVTGAENGK